ncbi:MAG: VIT domain-containing protein [Planctomycetota bacterium]|nr:VIT domain-containing protein [Planctomycetota bacterium]
MRHCWIPLTVGLISSSAHAAGLLAPKDQTLPPLRVTDHLVDVEIHDQVALTSVTQTFHNHTNRRLEATYLFPLPEHADLTNFQMTINGKFVEGEVLPADKAREIYESIVRRTKDPGLIEFIGRRLLQMRVFPIEPGSDTTIKLKYQQVVRPISGMHGYHYPLRTRKTAGQAYGMVRFSVSLHTTAPLKNIWSPSHSVEIVREGENAAKIGYEASGGSLEDDFLLLYDTDSSDLGLSVVTYQPDQSKPGHFVLMLTPKQLWPKSAYQPQDVVFVIDTSGSMAGEKIQQARRALQFCIDKLDEGDRFSVVRFSTGYDVLFEELVPAAKEKRAEAQNWIEQFGAAGGTNIADTLQHVLTMRPKAQDASVARPFVVVFLTDGRGNRQPDEIMTILAQAPAARVGLRIFPFGVGHDVNTILLDRLANEFTGRPTYVQPGENLELVLGDFFSVVSQPVLTNLRLALPAVGVTERFPATLGDLYHGQQLIIAGQFTTPVTGPVKLMATRNGKEIEYAWPSVAFASTAEATYVPAVWAGRKISYLIDQIRTHGESQEMIAEIVALSQQYGIQTPYTSWLVVPEQQEQLARRRPAPGMPSLPPGPASRAIQGQRLRGLGVVIREGDGGGFGGGPGRGGGGFGDSDGQLDVWFATEAVRADVGEAANIIARKNAQLKQLRSRDDDRLDLNRLPVQQFNNRWYHQIGQFLVDEDVDEETEIIIVRFGSEAYFELANGRADLRLVLAASRNAVVQVNATQAVLIADEKGIEQFSADQRKQFALLLR